MLDLAASLEQCISGVKHSFEERVVEVTLFNYQDDTV
jgi:hypothetical protein